MSQLAVYLGMPCGSRQVDIGASRGLFQTPCRPDVKFNVVPDFAMGSLLPHVFNTLWVRALRGRKTHGFTHFAMIHSDVDPELWWLEKLMEFIQYTEADVVSTVIPIKDSRGLTSTGGIAITDDGPLVRRLTMVEAHSLPQVFGKKDLPWGEDMALAVNTGLWVCDLRKDWVNEFHFHQDDAIVSKILENHDEPVPFANTSPEDWNASLDWDSYGATVMATTGVKVRHFGDIGFTNAEPWGEWETDREFESIVKKGYAAV